jgi:aspartate oxidase
MRGVHVTALQRASGRVAGVRGLDLGGHARALWAPAVVLACGGAGAVYAKHDNQATILGTGYRLAAEAGLDLWDMEFVQFYPIVLDEPGWPSVMIYPPYPPGATLRDPSGADLLQKHDLGDINRAITRSRDAFSALLVREAAAGAIRMDLRGVAPERWDAHPLRLLGRFRAECRARPVRITPAAHFCMGGVRTDEHGQTDLPGLFACGELVWGLHGANRMSGNALMECLVSGQIAGEGAAAFASAVGHDRNGPSQGRRNGEAGGDFAGGSRLGRARRSPGPAEADPGDGVDVCGRPALRTAHGRRRAGRREALHARANRGGAHAPGPHAPGRPAQRRLRAPRHPGRLSWDPDAGRFAVDYVPVETEPFDP